MGQTTYEADVVIIGAGLAGIATALELLDLGRSVLILDAAPEAAFGGLARWSFGGIFLVGSPEQKRAKIKDSVELALADWMAFAEFDEEDVIPRKWAEAYVHRCTEDIGGWLRRHSVRFVPIPHWTERGVFVPGNTVPRFHIAWGTGHGIVAALRGHLNEHPHAAKLQIRFGHRVSALESATGRVVGCVGEDAAGQPFFARACEAVVVAAGGFAGNFDRVRDHWPASLGAAPGDLLSGSHPYADGTMMMVVKQLGGNLTHLDRMWHYANGIKHWRPAHADHGLSLAVPRSALWVGYDGRRLGPPPLMFNYDAGYLTETVCRQTKPLSWIVMNWRIAKKELAISGAEFNPIIRKKQRLRLLWSLAFGNPELIRELIDQCEDVVVAESISGLAAEMNRLAGTNDVDPAVLAAEVSSFDQRVHTLRNDDQLRRIDHARQYRGDRARILKSAPIDDRAARPLIAIRQRVVTRKSLGGIQTDLESRVLDHAGNVLEGLYAVGEAAGFGGGGVHGHRSLEGTFLGGCILTGRFAAQSIAGRRP